MQGGKGFNNRRTDDRLSTLYRSDNFTSILLNKQTDTVNSKDNEIIDLTEKNMIESNSATTKPTNGRTVNQDISMSTDQQDTQPITEQKEPNSVQVVTGANFSGKSVYLKQIALIIYMAHVGRYFSGTK